MKVELITSTYVHTRNYTILNMQPPPVPAPVSPLSTVFQSTDAALADQSLCQSLLLVSSAVMSQSISNIIGSPPCASVSHNKNIINVIIKAKNNVVETYNGRVMVLSKVLFTHPPFSAIHSCRERRSHRNINSNTVPSQDHPVISYGVPSATPWLPFLQRRDELLSQNKALLFGKMRVSNH